jgi:hypothetical protein
MSSGTGNATISAAGPRHPNDFNGGTVIPCAVVTAVFSAVFVALRFYTRLSLVRQVGWEDWLMLVGLTFAMGLNAGTISRMIILNRSPAVLLGSFADIEFKNSTLVWEGTLNTRSLPWGTTSRHAPLRTHTLVTRIAPANTDQAHIFNNLNYSLSLTFTKISILCLYIRILTYERVRLAGKILLGTVIVTHTWIIIAILTSCIPLESFWSGGNKPRGYCHGSQVWWANAGIMAGTDFLIFLLPLPVVFRMKLPGRQKLGLLAAFMVAFGYALPRLLVSNQASNC